MRSTFSVVEASSGFLLLDHLETLEPWWVGMEALQGQNLFLHGYADRQTGRHGGLEAYAVPGGALRWQQPLLQFIEFRAGQVLAWNFQPGKEPQGVLVDPGNGTIIGEAQTGDFKLTAASDLTILEKPLDLPEQYAAGTNYFDLVRDFLDRHHPNTPEISLAVDYLETQQYILIGYYTPVGEEGWSHRVAVFNQSGNFLQDKVLSALVKGVGEAAFFLFQGNLFLLQDRKSLHCFVI